MVAEQADTPDTDASPPEADGTASGGTASGGTASGGGMGRLRLWSDAIWEMTRSHRFRTAAVVALICLPILIGMICQMIWSLPASIAVASGPEGGFYQAITDRLSKEIETRTGGEVDVTTVRTDGSLTNLRLLQEGQVDFVLYQAGTEKVVNGLESCFVARDEDEDGELTRKELISPYPHDVFCELDRNTDDSLTRDEYLAPCSGDVTPDAQRGKRAFNRLDTNRDGVLSMGEYTDTSSITFVANVASEAMHVIVDRDASIAGIEDLRGMEVALGPKDSGNYAASMIVLQHCGLAQRDQDMQWKCPSFKAVENLDYMQIKEKLLAGELKAAMINASTQSPILRELLGSGKFQLLSVPHTEALSATNLLVSQYKIPEGIYRCESDSAAFAPSANVDTIALRAQLLTRNDVHAGLVTRVTQIVLNEEFEKEGTLNELFVATNVERRAIACQRPEFPIHQGALAVYKPIGIDYYGFEKWYALYSLIASVCVASFVGYRWIRKQRARHRVVRLERYVDAIFDIERRQLALDVRPSANDVDELQRLLDAVTLLRQRALRELPSQEVIEDPAVYCFVQICHYVSTKLDAKISRQRLDGRFDELADSAQRANVSTGSSKKRAKKRKTSGRSKKA